MKKYVFTESQIKYIIKNVVDKKKSLINEQEIEVKQMMGVQTFLNYKFPKIKLKIDGVVGPKTTAAIKAYQQEIGVNPDGLWGQETIEAIKKRPSEWKLYKACIERRYNFIDKLFMPKL